ncbi:hypothetical protein B0T19DRAFT_435556 [Cercophora scortea]|uniref:Uncharacterized protein n=1 Tax=Cercophora scortea TaxID=314031 RepID=A0AAE0M397_9PEZI|nr:hypothetical protein B0T19DRAFT_435556 [Cercophora scortea]
MGVCSSSLRSSVVGFGLGLGLVHVTAQNAIVSLLASFQLGRWGVFNGRRREMPSRCRIPDDTDDELEASNRLTNERSSKTT